MQCICVDAADPSELARFWEQVLGWRRTHDSGAEVVLETPAGSAEDGVAPDLLFLRVPEAKSGKNRLHVDLRPTEQTDELKCPRKWGNSSRRNADVGIADSARQPQPSMGSVPVDMRAC